MTASGEPHVPLLRHGVFFASRKLRHYFMGHPIMVVSANPLADIIRNREATGWVVKWAVELNNFTITYEPRRAIKSQAPANFFAEWTETNQPAPVYESPRWTLYFDGSKMYEG